MQRCRVRSASFFGMPCFSRYAGEAHRKRRYDMIRRALMRLWALAHHEVQPDLLSLNEKATRLAARVDYRFGQSRRVGRWLAPGQRSLSNGHVVGTTSDSTWPSLPSSRPVAEPRYSELERGYC